MLYDPKWEIPDLEYSGVSLRAFIAWLETKSADEPYDFSNGLECATAQYLQGLGYEDPDCFVEFGPEKGWWLYQIVSRSPWTFGAALERGRKIANSNVPF